MWLIVLVLFVMILAEQRKITRYQRRQYFAVAVFVVALCLVLFGIRWGLKTFAGIDIDHMPPLEKTEPGEDYGER
jgi:hypothetical protein